MIDLNQPPVRAAGLTLFADDEQPPVWHYVPERPEIQMLPEGKPAYLLIKYRVNLSRREWPRGGGMLHLQCQLGPSHQALAEARTVLIARGGTLQNIVPLRSDRVTCELLVWRGEAEKQSVTAAPSSEPPFNASFQVPLTIPGVTLFEEALKAGQPTALLTYRLSVKARRPRLPARVTVDWRRVFERVSESGPVNAQTLIEQGDIRIEITEPDGGTALMDRVAEEASHIVATHLPATADRRTTGMFDLAQSREENSVIEASATLPQLLERFGPDSRPESLIALMEEVSHA